MACFGWFGYKFASPERLRMTFDKDQRLIGIVGSVLIALVFAWPLGWGGAVTLGIVFFVAFDMIVMRKPHTHRLRNWYLLRRRQPPNEDTLLFQAHAQSEILLWFGEIVWLACVSGAIFILVKAPEHWLAAVVGFGVGGFFGAFNTYMLVLRYTAAPPPSPNPVSQEKRLIGGG
jgi:hypothetical protein